MTWLESSYSGTGGTCVEVWRKSSYSGSATQGECVETLMTGDGVAVRDSKNPNGAILSFTTSEWVAFLKGVRAGEFDLA